MNKTPNTGLAVDEELVRKLALLLDETKLSEIEMANDGFRIRVARQIATTHIAPTSVTPSLPVPVPANTSGGVPAGTITAPMVGNVYLSARPGAAPFITVGDRVEKGQTLLIIEAMKVMNPIPSPKAGVVREIMVADGHPVEFGEPLLVLE
ncbi:MAG: acetyl-CoA carboxylase biotin carboxyl carrier protein [Holosporales bacterium]|jgi:acetyl-CoA carboxylase biotin carboxyl carrier protein